MDRDVLRPGGPCIQFQRLGLSCEIPRVIHDSSETVCWVVHRASVIFVLFLRMNNMLIV